MDAFDQSVLDRLLAGNHPALQVLAAQRAVATVRSQETTAGGRFTDFWIEAEVPALEVAHRFAIDDLYGTIEGSDEEVAFLLHVVRGRIKTLEAFLMGAPWPDQPELRETWYVAPDRAEAGQLKRVERRDLGFATRGLLGDQGLD